MNILIVQPGELKYTLEGIQVGPNEYSLRPKLIRGEEVRDVVKMQTEYAKKHPEFKRMPIMTSQLQGYAILVERAYQLLDEVSEREIAQLEPTFMENFRTLEKERVNFSMNISIWRTLPPWYGSLSRNLLEISSEIRKKMSLGGIAA